MIGIMLTADAFASIMLLIILYASWSEVKLKTTKDKIFVWFVAMNLLLTASDLISWILDRNTNLLTLNYIASYISISGAYAATFLFARYLIANIENYHHISRWHRIILDYYTLVMTFLSLSACLFGNVFTLEGGHYSTGSMYDTYLVSVFVMYVYIFLLAIFNFKVIGNYERTAFIIYSLSPFLAMIVEFIVPKLSLSYAASAVSILCIYIMLQSEYRVSSQQREKLLIESSNTDELTGVKNRRAYTSALELIGENVRCGVLFCDVNGLKYFNDTYGHNTGDKLIIEFASKLKNVFDRSEVYRISGDEFVVISRGRDKDTFDALAAPFCTPSADSDYTIAAAGSAYGIGRDLDKLLRKAEESMYVQKAIFHRHFPKYVRKGNLFMRNISDDVNDIPEVMGSMLEEDDLPSELNITKHTVMLIEDTEQHELIKRLLESDFNVVDCPVISEALSYLEQHAGEVEVVLIDSELPRINPFEFLQIKQPNPAIAGVPVIVTALPGEKNIESRYLRIGAFDFIHKPYSPDMLINRLQRTIEMKESIATLSAVERDELTGLYTRQVFCHHMLRRLDREATRQFDLAVFDIRNFKLINERRGEKHADSVLRSIGLFLIDSIGSDGLAGRYSGDQLMCLIPHENAAAPDFWNDFTARMEKSCNIDDITIKCGIYENVDHASTAAVLCYRALTALRTIKPMYGHSCSMFDSHMQLKLDREQQLEADMRMAVADGQLKVFYQPKCDPNTGKPVGAEALLRWQHPIYGFLSPDEFIPLFERSGFITDTDYYVWEHTLQNLKRWQTAGIKPVPISVNASRRDFAVDGYLTKLRDSLNETGLDCSLLHIEITESMFTDRTEELASEIKLFRDCGFKIELDDFGTGYSALNALGTLPIDIVKFDKKFIDEYKDSKKSRVLEASIALVKGLGFETVIEGVETIEQHDAVVRMGGDIIQGYYYSRPLPEKEFEEYMKREQSSHK